MSCCRSGSRNLRYGYHDTQSTITESVHNRKVTQIFMGNPRTYNIKKYSSQDILSGKHICETQDSRFYVHAPYVCTMASEKRESYNSLCSILDNIHSLPSSVVVHIGNHKDRSLDKALNTVINNVNQMIVDKNIIGQFTSPKFKILLENSSGKSNDVGKNFNEIRKLFEGFDRCVAGICYDTQHAFASGCNELQTHEDAIKIFEDCYNATSFYPQMIHLNDSKVPFASGKDRHECLGDGYIWNREQVCLDSLRRYCQDLEIDIISETPNPLKDHIYLDEVSNKYS